MEYDIDNKELAERVEQTKARIPRPTPATSLDCYISQLTAQLEGPNIEKLVKGVIEKAVEMYACFRDEMGCQTIGSVMKAISERRVHATLMMQWLREGRFTVAIPEGVIEEGYPELDTIFQESRDGLVARFLYQTGTNDHETNRMRGSHKSIA